MAKRNQTNTITRKKSIRRDQKEMPEFESEDMRASSRNQSLNSRGDYKDILKELAMSPTARYIAGGLAAAVLTRLANHWAEKYPEISNFIRDNVSTLEGKLGTKDGLADSLSRH